MNVIARSLLLIFSAYTCIVRVSFAAEINCGNKAFPQYLYPAAPPESACADIRITGEIVEGDYDRFRSILKRSEPYALSVTVLSPGGDLYEGIKIGSLIRQRLLSTTTASVIDGTNVLFSSDSRDISCVGDTCICASTCFVIWVAGIQRLGNALILHRPRDDSGGFGKKRVESARIEYQNVLDEISAYLLAMEVPDKYFEIMKSIPSADYFEVPPDDVDRDLSGFIPTMQEWLAADCGAMTAVDSAGIRYCIKQYWIKSEQERAAAGDRLKSACEATGNKQRQVGTCYLEKLVLERARLAREVPL